MKLVLGTVQFGLPYGVANRTGQVSAGEVATILHVAQSAGIATLDTAAGYGESEASLGRAGLGNRWRAVTKVSRVPESHADPRAWVLASAEESLRRLGIKKLHGLLLHHPADLSGPRGADVYAGLLEVQRRGWAEKIGISIYDPAELNILSVYPMDLIQGPFNVIDRRILTSGWLDRLAAKGVEIHTRSVFLQGLLLMRAQDRPARFDAWGKTWTAWHGWLDDIGATALETALGFAMMHEQVNGVVVGVDGVAHLQEIIAASRKKPPAAPIGIASEEDSLINPARWQG